MPSLSPRPFELPTRIAVTGASGFVGRHLVEHLHAQGIAAVGISRSMGMSGSAWVRVDGYEDEPTLERAFAGCKAVVHLAARAHVLKESAESPLLAFRRANVDTTMHAARAAQRAGVERFVLISSVGVHGNATQGLAFTEADPPSPKEAYAESKLEGERSVAALLQGGRTQLVVLRPPLVYGWDCPGNFRLLLRLVAKLPITPFGGLHRKRHLIFVTNLCSAILTACQHPAAAGGTFLVSDNEAVSIAEIVRALNAGYGHPTSRVRYAPRTLLQLLAILAGRRAAFEKLAGELTIDAGRFRAATGWHPPFSAPDALKETATGYQRAQQRLTEEVCA